MLVGLSSFILTILGKQIKQNNVFHLENNINLLNQRFQLLHANFISFVSFVLPWIIIVSDKCCFTNTRFAPENDEIFFLLQRLRSMVVPTEVPNHSDDVVIPVQL